MAVPPMHIDHPSQHKIHDVIARTKFIHELRLLYDIWQYPDITKIDIILPVLAHRPLLPLL